MKKSVLILAAAAFITGTAITSCKSPEEKVENAQDKVIEANKNLDQANEDYLVDMDNYRKEEAARIAANDQTIAEYKAKIDQEKKETRAENQRKLAELEQKNIDMKRKLDDYKPDGKEKWQSFKTEFNHDMDGLGDAFRNLTVKNVK